MELFTWKDVLAYFAFTLSTIGWAVVKKYPKSSYFLNFAGGVAMMIFGYCLGNTAIIVINGIWSTISIIHLVQK